MVIERAEGITSAERYLQRLCERSFLSLWSYAGIFRDQGKQNVGDGKEVCDLLVVFGDKVLIFSDKDCAFPDSGDPNLDWRRWYKRAIAKSVDQIMGAERWIRDHPDRLFLDRCCTKPFPISLPAPGDMRVHRIVVVPSIAEHAKDHLGGSGSLAIDTAVEGAALPFSIGRVAPVGAFVHVLDDHTLDIVLETLDTVPDFVAYLECKEQCLQGDSHIQSAGEEELLAHFLSRADESGMHDFIIDQTHMSGFVSVQAKVIQFSRGGWERFSCSSTRAMQRMANEVSYAWDALIEEFTCHIFGGTQYFATHPEPREQEIGLRFLARENRTRRRMLAEALLAILRERQVENLRLRTICPSFPGDPYYAFVTFKHDPSLTEEQYRQRRFDLLHACCLITHYRFPDAMDIVGLATEPGHLNERSEDLCYLNGREWNQQDTEQARFLEKTLNLGKDMRAIASIVHEYPKVKYLQPSQDQGRPKTFVMPAHPSSSRHRYQNHHRRQLCRNDPCPCVSGRKYKHCCGR